MSAIPANLTVAFKALTIGTHRIAYRVGSSGTYSYVSTSCATLGDCNVVIPIFVDNDSCEDLHYEGYIQSECEELSSENGRLPWALDFTTVPNCKAYVVQCYQLDIASVTINEPGNGYLTPPTVNFVGGGGVATGTAAIGAGKILSFVISSPGSGYANGTYTNVSILGGSGTGALATVVISGGVVTSVTITNGGSGYVTGDAVLLDSSDVGGPPSLDAELTASSDLSTVIGITSIVTTTKFTSVPAIVITGGSGSGATGTVLLAECPEIDSPGCIGSGVIIAQGVLEITEQVVVCAESEPAQEAEYQVSEQGNCVCSGVLATIGVAGSPGSQVRASWNKNALEARSIVLTRGGSPQTIIDCIVPGSLVFQILTVGATGTVSYGANC